ETQAWVNGVAAAAVGVLVAVIAHDGIGAAVIGFAQAAPALAVGLGLDWSSEKQAVVLLRFSRRGRWGDSQTCGGQAAVDQVGSELDPA
ncbi:hypothetical protein ACFY9A_39530, partial [Streptomyces rubradiris]